VLHAVESAVTKDDLKLKILEQWHRYMPDPTHAEYQDKLKFYAWLQEAYPELLQWKEGTELDRWQEMVTWLTSEKSGKKY
jgi:hypothetical protein